MAVERGGRGQILFASLQKQRVAGQFLKCALIGQKAAEPHPPCHQDEMMQPSSWFAGGPNTFGLEAFADYTLPRFVVQDFHWLCLGRVLITMRDPKKNRIIC